MEQNEIDEKLESYKVCAPPKPQSGESESEYISRCVSRLMDEDVDQKEALAMCYGMWRSGKEMEKDMKDSYMKINDILGKFIEYLEI